MSDGTVVEIDQRVGPTQGGALDSLYDGRATRPDGGEVFVQVFTRAPQAPALERVAEHVLTDSTIAWNLPGQSNETGRALKPFGRLTFVTTMDPHPLT